MGFVVHGGARAERRRGTHGRGSGGAAFPTPCGTRCAWRRPAALPRRVRVALRVRVKVRVRVIPRERTKSSEGKAALGRLQVFCQPLAEQRCPPEPRSNLRARNLKSDEWSAVAIRPEHDQGASAADTGFVEDVVPRALPVCLEQLSTPTASSVPAEPATPSRLPTCSQSWSYVP